MNKRVLSLLLALAAFLALACGCNGKSEDAASADDSGVASDTVGSTTVSDAESVGVTENEAVNEWKWGDPVALPLTEDLVTVTMYHTKSPELLQVNPEPAASEGMKELQSRTNVQIEYIWGDFSNSSLQFNVLIASGDYPDILSSVSQNYSGGLGKAYDDGIIVELTKYVDEYMPNYKYIINSVEERKLAAYTDEGFMLECALFQVDRQVVLGPFVRKDWLDKLGISAEDIRTYNDYHDVLLKFKTELGKSNALWLGTSGVPEFNYLAAGYGVAADQSIYGVGHAFFQVNGKVKFGPMCDGYLNYISMIRQWYEEGLVYKDFVSQIYPATLFTEAAAGNVGICTCYTSFVFIFKASSGDENFSMSGLYDAVQNIGDKLHLRRNSGVYENRGNAISTTCKNVELVAKWLDYGYSYEGYILGNYGIDGITYESTDEPMDTNPPLTEFVLKNPDGLTLQQAQERYIGVSGLLANLDDAQQWSDEIVAATEKWAELSDNAYAIPSAVTMTPEESQEYALLYGDISTYALEWQIGCILGNNSVDDYGGFVTQLEKMGINRCIEIRQDALERYYNRGRIAAR